MPIVSIDNEDDKNTTGSTTSLQGTGATEKVVIKRSSSAQLRAANKKLQRRRRTSTIIRYTVLTVVGLIMIYPLVWMVGATFKENSEIFTSMNPIPLKATFNGYKNAIKSYGGNINIGESRRLTATATPSSATNTGINWSSSNPSVVTVSGSGTVTAVGYGDATVTATAADGSGVYAELTFRCIKPVKAITVNPSYVTMLNGNTAKVTATVSPADASIPNIAWSSSDESVATVAIDISGRSYCNI